jgi:short-subunit dehydrogenase
MQNILITGATSGIGRHAALALARRGHTVFATGRNRAALDILAQEAADLPLHTLPLDVTRPESIADAAAAVGALTEGKGLDVLINNAGYGHMGPTELVSDAALRQQFDTNVFGLMSVTRAFLPGMRARGSGRIINISSVGGRMTFPYMGVYNASKYAVESLSDALRIELKPFGVQVVLVEPGPIRTQFSDTAFDSTFQYRSRTSPYAEAMARAGEVKTTSDRLSGSTQDVSKGIIKAVESRRPHARYVVPFSNNLMLVLAAWLPTAWMDGIMGWVTAPKKAAVTGADPAEVHAA